LASLILYRFLTGYQLEKAEKKEAAFYVTFAKSEKDMAELKVIP